ncbi:MULTISPECIES: chemotaxis protein CheC [Undibacterium]|jgi:chemotaxis protein CheC|uniref:Chemotaxis protein CheC n=1 Tax=Undibacterium parvum TaxID=401471 RepID=A0A3S9HG89_9BURK|nr:MULTISPECIES: chemotaxis protein CheC [Undibacterium]AZP11113.1 chemotaxis protein CheC [Undibacterium parvum]MCX7219448.1 chemotaxis protein CheC [Burkholderiales bacterium]
MDSLSELHLDALTEVFNVGAGRAAASLSEIVGDEVKLSVPSIEVKKSSEADSSVIALNSARFGAVSQQFSGPFDAEAVLLFTEDHALEIVRDMMGSQMSIEELAEFEQEAMCELGNIILNACLSAMADMLSISLNSSLPTYRIATTEEIFKGISNSTDQPYILVLHIDLTIEKRHSEGHLIFLLSSKSLRNLVVQIDRFLGAI